ncbi:MAG: caspase family protein [Bacteroidota bacterium]
MRLLINLAVAVLVLRPFFLSAQAKPELVITTGHIGMINYIDYHPSGKFLASCSEDHTVKIWDCQLQQEYRTLYGHTDKVSKAVFSPDGNYLASIDSREAIVWDHLTGKVISRTKAESFTNRLFFTADSKSILIELEDGIAVVDVLSGNTVKTFSGAKGQAAFSSAAGKLFTECYADKCGDENFVLAATDISSGELTTFYKGATSNPSLLTASQKGDKLAAYIPGAKRQVLIWDIVSGSLKQKIELPLTTDLTHMSFNADGGQLLVCTRENKVVIYNTASGSVLKEIKPFIDYTQIAMQKGEYDLGINVCGIALHPDGNGFAFANMYMHSSPDQFMDTRYSIFIYDLKTFAKTGELSGKPRMILNLWASKSQPYMISYNQNPVHGIKFWNTKEGAIQYSIKAIGIGASSAMSDTVAYLSKNSIKVISVSDFKEIFSVSNPLTSALGMSPDGKKLAASAMNASNPSSPKIDFKVWDVVSGKLIKSFSVPVMNMGNQTQIWFSADSKKIALCGEKLHIWDISGELKKTEIPLPFSTVVFAGFNPAKGTAMVSFPDEETSTQPWIAEYDCSSGKETERYPLEGIKGWVAGADFSDDCKYYAVGISDNVEGLNNVVAVYEWPGKKLVCTLKGHEAQVNRVCFGHDGKTIYSAAFDGTIRSWDLGQCRMNGTFIGMIDLDYIIFSPDNYYKTSKGNYGGICFRLNNKLYTYDQFDMVYNRPDLVMAQLGAPKSLTAMYKMAWIKRIKKSGFAEEMLSGDLQLPELQISGKDKLPLSVSQPAMTFTVKAEDKSNKLLRLHIYVNDVPVYGMKGYDLKSKSANKLEETFSIELAAGKNFVQVYVMNEKGLESLKESFEVECKKPPVKRNLYVLAVGVSKYKDKNYNLKYASKDMNDFTAMIEKSGTYEKVVIKKLADSLAVKESIIEAGKLFAQAAIDDQVVIYVSCHGLLDENLDYFLATYDVDFNSPAARGLPYDELEKMLDACKSRNRLVLIDACHSGEVDKDDLQVDKSNTNTQVVMTKSGGVSVKPKAGLKNSFAYMQALFSDVSKGSGAIVISAAAGAEFALESPEWNNGVFTYCILKGIKSGEADDNKDKNITISELKNYVIINVAELTKGAQVPTARKENSFNDFVIYRKM